MPDPEAVARLIRETAQSVILPRFGTLKREEMREALGNRFDIRDFHEAVLAPGAMPLPVLTEHVRLFGAGLDGVLLHKGGAYMSDNAFNYQWRRAQVGAGRVAGSLRFHWLRHAFASSLISAGCSVKAVADAMGHQSPTITLQTYASLWPGDDDRIRQALATVWCESIREEMELAP